MSPLALLSIHDVMPETLPQVRGILHWLEGLGLGKAPVTLLVVPGMDEMDALRGFQAQGLALAGHGWHHEAVPAAQRTRWHRMHSVVLSRNAAEHLSRPAEELRELIARNHAWFAEHGLKPPSLYVPPAWAMGALTRKDLRTLPFRYYETLTGVYDAREDRFHRMPLAGFEADTAGREAALTLWNGMNARLAGWSGAPLRIGFHPNDLELRMREDIRGLLMKWRWTFLEYGDLGGEWGAKGAFPA